MSEGYLGEIRLFAGNFAPAGWAICDGTLLNVANNQALYSLLGNLYGGTPNSTFALPDLRGRVPLHQGLGAGLTQRNMGDQVGTETVPLNTNQIPSHTHSLMASTAAATVQPATNAVPAAAKVTNNGQPVSPDPFMYTGALTTPVQLNAAAIQSTGGAAHENMMPTLCMNYIICLSGIYPSRD